MPDYVHDFISESSHFLILTSAAVIQSEEVS